MILIVSIKKRKHERFGTFHTFITFSTTKAKKKEGKVSRASISFEIPQMSFKSMSLIGLMQMMH